MICMDDLEGVFSRTNTPKGRTETHTSLLFLYKQVGEMEVMNDLE